MSVGVEALFTSALGLQPPWVVEDVLLDVASKRIDFEVRCDGTLLSCPACGAASQPVHDRLRRKWRHLDFFQFEAWLHADVPRVAWVFYLLLLVAFLLRPVRKAAQPARPPAEPIPQ